MEDNDETRGFKNGLEGDDIGDTGIGDEDPFVGDENSVKPGVDIAGELAFRSDRRVRHR